MNYKGQQSIWLWISGGLLFASVAMVLLFRFAELALQFKGTLLHELSTLMFISSLEPIVNSLPVWFVYSLPNAMLVAAVLCVFGFVVRGSLNTAYKLALAVVPVLAFSSEIMQLTGHLPGTFDLFDMVCYFFATIVPVSLFVQDEPEKVLVAGEVSLPSRPY